MKFKSIAKIFVGLSPIACVLISWVMHRIQHMDVHVFLANKSQGGDTFCAFADVILMFMCIVGIAWGICEALSEIKKLNEKDKDNA